MELLGNIDHKLKEIDELLMKNAVNKQLIQTYYNDVSVIASELKEMEVKYNNTKKVITVFQKMSDERGQKSREDIQNLINNALSSIFPERDYAVVIEEYSYKNSKHMRVLLSEDGQERELKYCHGTLLKQVVSFLFNICILVFKGSARVLILDELFNGVHWDKARVLSNILVTLSKNNGFQFFIIGHERELFYGKEFLIFNLVGKNKKLEIEGIYNGSSSMPDKEQIID